MIKAIERMKKGLFGYCCETNLDMSTCLQRLTNEYLQKIEDDDLLYKHKKLWSFVFMDPKRGMIIISINTGKFFYTFKITLHANSDSTIIDFYLSSPFGRILFPITVIYVLGIVFFSILSIMTANPQGILTAFLGLGLFFYVVLSPIYIIAFLCSKTARSIVEDYLEKVLEAKLLENTRHAFSDSA